MNPEGRSDQIKSEYVAALKLALLQQVPSLVICALLLDFGKMLRLCLISMLGFWLLAMVCLSRGHRQHDPAGLMFLRWGFFPLFAVVALLNGFIGPVFTR